MTSEDVPRRCRPRERAGRARGCSAASSLPLQRLEPDDQPGPGRPGRAVTRPPPPRGSQARRTPAARRPASRPGLRQAPRICLARPTGVGEVERSAWRAAAWPVSRVQPVSAAPPRFSDVIPRSRKPAPRWRRPRATGGRAGRRPARGIRSSSNALLLDGTQARTAGPAHGLALLAARRTWRAGPGRAGSGGHVGQPQVEPGRGRGADGRRRRPAVKQVQAPCSVGSGRSPARGRGRARVSRVQVRRSAPLRSAQKPRPGRRRATRGRAGGRPARPGRRFAAA